MTDCLFCKVFKKEIDAEIIYEDGNVIGFKDINPQAKTHLLFIHKTHSENINQMVRLSSSQLNQVFSAIEKYTNENGIEDNGFRLVTNVGASAGQSVFHTHIHLLSGENLGKFGA
ncbi:MAG: HIT domain-containing protein [Bacteriovoracaceae bacterium]